MRHTDSKGMRRAWALEYHELVPAPIVIACGKGWQAEAIEKVARSTGIPVVADPGLAMQLEGVRLGQAIPESCYRVVAALYRYVYELETRELGKVHEEPSGQ